jgi:hypothetical protein
MSNFELRILRDVDPFDEIMANEDFFPKEGPGPMDGSRYRGSARWREPSENHAFRSVSMIVVTGVRSIMQ